MWLLIYLIQCGFLFIVFWLLYALLLRNTTFFSLNRFYLIGAGLISSLYPIVQFTSHSNALPTYTLSEIVIHQNSTFNKPGMPSAFDPVYFIIVLYLLGIAIGIGRFVFEWVKLKKLIRQSIKISNQVAILPESSNQTAFTFLNTVYLHPSIDKQERETILAHELVHVHQHHYIDLILFELLCCVFWFNPLYRLAKTSLMTTHEFIADEKACGNNRLYYSQMLVTKALKLPASFFNSFSQTNNLKRRLIMLTQQKSPRKRLIRYAFVIPVCITALCIQSFNIKTENKTATESSKEVNSSLKGLSTLVTAGDKPAEFKGGFTELSKYLSSTILYPEDAKKQKIEGKVYVEFTVTKDGSIKNVTVKKGVHKLLDEEASRVVSAMPAWEPAIAEGKKANSQMVLPIVFKL